MVRCGTERERDRETGVGERGYRCGRERVRRERDRGGKEKDRTRDRGGREREKKEIQERQRNTEM